LRKYRKQRRNGKDGDEAGEKFLNKPVHLFALST